MFDRGGRKMQAKSPTSDAGPSGAPTGSDPQVFQTRKQYSVLTMNTLAFTVNFAVWTMFSVIGIRIKAQLGLNDTEFGLLVATPILTGSLTRLPLGILTDRFGGRVVFFIQMILVAIPTYGLAFATQYWQYLVIGLFVGLAGGSFAIGIAYTSAWFPKEKQGTAMGIFGAGNAGAAVTNLAAPLILVAFGWRAVPQVYSIVMLAMAVLFWFFTYPDPKLEERRRKKSFPSLTEQLAPLAELRVWRFGLAYYFVFGGFVALALWLPKYYVAEYGLSLRSAAFITMLFTLPSGVIRALGGWISDKFGGSTTTWWVFWVCIVCLFFMSYPPTTLLVHGTKGDVTLHIAVGVILFTVLVFVVGMAMGIGKASVYRELADYYPANMGAVGGLVGVIGGLGGFSLPIMFGIAADASGVRSSTFMLMYAVVAGVMVWTWMAERGERAAVLYREPALRDQMVKEHLIGVGAARRWLTDWRPDDDAFWQQQGRRIALRNLILSMPPLFLSFAVWMVWSVVVVELPKIGFQFTTSQLFWLAAAPGISGGALRLAYAFVVPIFGGRNWTVFSTASLLLPTLWMALAIQDPTTNYMVFVAIALLCGLGGGNFSASMANISFFFPKRMQGTALGWNAGAGNLGVGVMQAVVPLTIYGGALAIMGGTSQTYTDGALVTKVWMQNAAFIWIPFILAATIAAAWGQNNIRGAQASFARAGRHFPAQARLDPGVALHRHIRLVHRVCRGIPATAVDAVPGIRSQALGLRRSVARRAGAAARRLAVGPRRRRQGHLLEFRRHAHCRGRDRGLAAGDPKRCHVAVVLRRFHPAVRHDRHRKRFGVPCRSQSLLEAAHTRSRDRQGVTGSCNCRGRNRIVRRARVHGRHRRARAVLHPGADRNLHRYDRDGGNRHGRLRRVLRDVSVGDLVVVPAQASRSAMRLNEQTAARQ